MPDLVHQRLVMHRDRLTLGDLRDMCDMLHDWPDHAPVTDHDQPITQLTAAYPVEVPNA